MLALVDLLRSWLDNWTNLAVLTTFNHLLLSHILTETFSLFLIKNIGHFQEVGYLRFSVASATNTAYRYISLVKLKAAISMILIRLKEKWECSNLAHAQLHYNRPPSIYSLVKMCSQIPGTTWVVGTSMIFFGTKGDTWSWKQILLPIHIDTPYTHICVQIHPLHRNTCKNSIHNILAQTHHKKHIHTHHSKKTHIQIYTHRIQTQHNTYTHIRRYTIYKHTHTHTHTQVQI